MAGSSESSPSRPKFLTQLKNTFQRAFSSRDNLTESDDSIEPAICPEASMAASSRSTEPFVSSRNTMSQLNNSNENIETDSQPEGPEEIRNGDEEICNMPNVHILGSKAQRTLPIPAAPASTQQNTSHGAAVKNYSAHQHKKYNPFHILILHTEDDHEAAKAFKNEIKKFKISFGDKNRPEVRLLDDVIEAGYSKFTELDRVVSMTVYVFLYVTESFCRDASNIFQSNSCLERALNDINRRWTVIPVHTVPKPDRNYELPMLLGHLKPLNSFAKSFEKDVKKLLEHKKDFIFERMASYKGKNMQKCNEDHLQPSRTSHETVRKSYIDASGNTPLDATHNDDSGFVSYTSGLESRSFTREDSQVTTDDASDNDDSRFSTENVGKFARAPRHPPPPYMEEQSLLTSYSRDALHQGDYSATDVAPTLDFTSFPEADDNKALPPSNLSNFRLESFTGRNFMQNSHLYPSHTRAQTQQMGSYDGSQGIDSGIQFNQPLQSNMPEHADFSHSRQQKVKCEPGKPIRNSAAQTEDMPSSHITATRYKFLQSEVVAINSVVNVYLSNENDKGGLEH